MTAHTKSEKRLPNPRSILPKSKIEAHNSGSPADSPGHVMAQILDRKTYQAIVRSSSQPAHIPFGLDPVPAGSPPVRATYGLQIVDHHFIALQVTPGEARNSLFHDFKA